MSAQCGGDLRNTHWEDNWFGQLIPIGANIAEGYGRYAFKENIQFCYYARGSLYETLYFLRRAKKRGLLKEHLERDLNKLTDTLTPKLNAYINSIKSRSKNTSDR